MSKIIKVYSKNKKAFVYITMLKDSMYLKHVGPIREQCEMRFCANMRSGIKSTKCRAHEVEQTFLNKAQRAAIRKTFAKQIKEGEDYVDRRSRLIASLKGDL